MKSVLAGSNLTELGTIDTAAAQHKRQTIEGYDNTVVTVCGAHILIAGNHSKRRKKKWNETLCTVGCNIVVA